MTHDLTGKDKYRYQVGRYVQFLYDGNPGVCKRVRKIASGHVESLANYLHRMDDLTEEAIAYRRTPKMTSPIASPSERNVEFLATLKQLKEKAIV